jgi:membrane protein YqaA with SNARE-associated domain
MRKSLILVLIAIGSAASYAGGVTEVTMGSGTNDPSTWRWQVNAILAEQRVTVSRPSADRSSFDQGYERYSPLGLLDPQRDHSR